MKQYNMVLIKPDGTNPQLVGQSDDPQWYVEIYHTEGKLITPTSWQTNDGILHALELNGTLQFTSPFVLSGEDTAEVFDVPKEVDKQPIDTAPKDGTIIMGYWEGDEDPRAQPVKWANAGIAEGWYTLCEADTKAECWVECDLLPTHWTPIN